MPAKLAIKQLLGLSPKISVQTRFPTEYHGSVYGGWTIKKNSLTRSSVVFSVGIGNDISFDLSLIHQYGVEVIGIDPTPQVRDWLKAREVPALFRFLPVGLSAEDGEAKFYKPDNREHISHSIRPGSKENQEFIMVPMCSISSLLKKNGLTRIDLLKMDIEGFEYEVIGDIMAKGIPIGQLLIEFHHGMYGFSNQDTLKAISLLNEAGFKIFSISSTGREISFIEGR